MAGFSFIPRGVDFTFISSNSSLFYSGITIHTFQQSKYPRIYLDTLLPVAKTLDPKKQDMEDW